MKQILIICAVLFLLVACQQPNADKLKAIPQAAKKVVVLQPLSSFSTKELSSLKDSIARFYPIKIIIALPKQMPPNAWYEPRQRWLASKIIEWLRNTTADTIRLTVGLTKDDISTTKGSIKNYGIMGLGYQPGNACVVSSFRLKRNIDSPEQLKQRLFKVVAHEMGHNFGLPHCPNQHCMMVDAEGKMKLDQVKDLCQSCKLKLKI